MVARGNGRGDAMSEHDLIHYFDMVDGRSNNGHYVEHARFMGQLMDLKMSGSAAFDARWVDQHLGAGNLIMAFVNSTALPPLAGHGYVRDAGHAIVITERTAQGYRVHDPGWPQPYEISPQQLHLVSGSSQLCQFTLTLPNPGTVAITAAATSADDPNTGNNTATGTIVVGTPDPTITTDVAVYSVALSVNGVTQPSLSTIPQGSTANYLVTFINNSTHDATTTCTVTVGSLTGPVSVPLVNTPARIQVPAGRTATCSFAFVFSAIVAETFTVTADNVTPLDATPGNNIFSFQTVSQSDHTFPGIDHTNVSATQRWVTDAVTLVPTVLNEQRASVNRITLTFAATSAILGDFKLTGNVTTDGRPISNATWTVLGLRPGQNGFANCVLGVDPGATAINNHVLTLKICAQEAPGQPGIQSIFVEYDSRMPTAMNSPDPLTLFGSSIIFDMSLTWTLSGSLVSDHASAKLQFGLQNVNTGFPTVHEITSTGVVSVIRNGGA